MEAESRNIAIFSSCLEPWGGSEELWSQSAEILAKQGFKIHIFKFTVDFTNPTIKRLLELGCEITDLNAFLPSLLRRVWNKFLPHSSFRTLPNYIRKHLGNEVKRLKPRLFVINQGSNFDAFEFLGYCPTDRIPYVIISQRADINYWPNDNDRGIMRKLWTESAGNFFVSEHNRKLTEEQFGLTINNAEVVRNPFLTQTPGALDWDFGKDEKVRLACVGRLFVQDKGQDILLRVLADKKWRERNLEISFFGRGRNKVGLLELGKYLNLQNVVFSGHVTDVLSIWKTHHGLVLPSRNEGLPLVLVEAMLCGRTAIVTNVGGNSEVLDDNVTGFIAKSVTESGVDEALERAWQRVDEWREIGVLAAQRIREKVPANPPEVFAQKLMTIIDERSSSVHETDD